MIVGLLAFLGQTRGCGGREGRGTRGSFRFAELSLSRYLSLLLFEARPGREVGGYTMDAHEGVIDKWAMTWPATNTSRSIESLR